jgi:cysteinyl-tRNA synthetase
MYVCGPTVYDHAHLGHARTYVVMDVVARYLKLRGYRVRYIRGFIDMDRIADGEEDRLALGARRLGIMPTELADTYIWSFHDDMDALGVLRPNISARASCHVPLMVAWVEDLIDLGYAYEAGDSVYFSVDRFADYGKLSQQVSGMQQANIDFDRGQDRRNPSDFVLWRSADSESPLRWPSPWGLGGPSSHVAYSVMANTYLGKTFDIHGGGIGDLVPRNNCELAQSEVHNGVPPAKYWFLVGDLRVAGQRMSRSLGNHLTIKDALKLYSPEAIRYFSLSTPYREPVEFRRDALQAAQRDVDHLHQTVRRLRWRMQETLPSMGSGTAAFSSFASLPDYREDFSDAMDHDFDTARALTVVLDLVEEVDRTLTADREASLGTLSTMDKLFRDLAGGVLGILPDTVVSSGEGKRVEQLVEILLELRSDHIAAGQWSQADAILSRLDEIGVTIRSGPQDTSWRFKGS